MVQLHEIQVVEKPLEAIARLEAKWKDKTVRIHKSAAHEQRGNVGKVLCAVNTIAGLALMVHVGKVACYVFDLGALTIVE